jgi:formylglycine-generating enzyme required for sulfatase activity
MSPGFDAHHKWLGIPPEEQPPNHYRLLGIKLFESDPDVIEYAADRQMAHLRTFQAGRHSAASQTLLNQVASAKVCLLNAEKKAAYDAALRAQMESLTPASAPSTSPADVTQDWVALVPTGARPWSASRRRRVSFSTVIGVSAAVLLGVVLVVGLFARRQTPRVAESSNAAKPKPTAEAASPASNAMPVATASAPPPPTPAEQTAAPSAPAEAAAKPPAESASREKPPVSLPGKRLNNSIGMQFVLIPAGEFWMGSTQEEIDWALNEAQALNDAGILARIPGEAPRHRVKITRPFYMSVYEVTQSQFEQVLKSDRSSTAPDDEESKEPTSSDAGRLGVRKVSWNAAARFCKTLSLLPGERAVQREYRLPTEAEWEYAARAGSTTKWSFGDVPAAMEDHGWFKSNAGGRRHPVGQKAPNAWGLYDMHGNMWEWCSDWYDGKYYRDSPASDPTGPASGSTRVLRGGAWDASEMLCRSAYRSFDSPRHLSPRIGFRVVTAP